MRSFRTTKSFLGAWMMVSLSLSMLKADTNSTWNQWRGPYRNGMADEAVWPQGLDNSQLTRQWSAELQPSYSVPIVWGNLVYTTETVDEQVERVSAWDRTSGQQIWSQQWDGAMKVPFFAASRGSWIRSTPSCDGEHVFVGGMRDVLVALDAATGEIRWQVNFVKLLSAPLPAFGFVSSPLVDGNAIYVQAGGSVVKLDKRNGQIIWQSLSDGGGMYGSAFSSPVIATLQGQRQLVVQSREKLAGLNLDTGEILWSQAVPAFRGMNILTPTVIDDRLFTSSYGGRSFLYQVERDGENYAIDTSWENKVQGYMSSPVVIDGHIYMHLRNRRFTCIDLATGKEKWITKPFGEYWSLIANGDRILALDETGELLLVRANPEEFELLDRRQVAGESSWAHLAIDGDQIFVRGLNSLSAFRWRNDSLPQSAP